MEQMHTGQIKNVTHAKLIFSQNLSVTDDIYIDLRTLGYIIVADDKLKNNYLFYKSKTDTAYFKEDTLLLYDFNTNTLKPLHIHIDYCVMAVKLYKNMLFIATINNDITVYDLTTLEYIKTLCTGLRHILYLIEYITIYEDNTSDMQNVFVLTQNYKYNAVWNFNTGEFIQYPEPLRNRQWKIYIDNIDNIDNKVYLYSPYEIIVFTDTSFQNYKSIHSFIKPEYSYSIYRVDNYLQVGNIKFDSTTYEKLDDDYFIYKAGSYPYFRYPYILFKECRTIIVTDYKLNKIDAITLCDNFNDEIEQMYICGNKIYCVIDDGSVKTITIYCTKKCVHDMEKYITNCEYIPQELSNIIMSYVEFKSIT